MRKLKIARKSPETKRTSSIENGCQILYRRLPLPAAAEAAHGAVAARGGAERRLHAGRCELYLLLGAAPAGDEPPVPRTRLLHRCHHLRLQRPQGGARRLGRHLHRRGDRGRQRPAIRGHDARRDAPRGGPRGAAPLRTARQDAAHQRPDAPQGRQMHASARARCC